jgi:hypothetical protein
MEVNIAPLRCGVRCGAKKGVAPGYMKAGELGTTNSAGFVTLIFDKAIVLQSNSPYIWQRKTTSGTK